MRNKTFIFVAGFLCVLLVGAVAVYLYDQSQSDDIAKGVKVGGVDLGGLSKAQAREKLQRELVGPLNQPVKVTGPGGARFTLTAKRARVTMDVNGMVQEAIDKSRSGSIFSRAWRGVTGGTLTANLAPKVDYSASAVNRLVRRARREINRRPQDATVNPGAGGLRRVAAHNGLTVRTAQLRNQLQHMLTVPSDARKVAVGVTKVPPKVTVHDLVRKYPNYIVINRNEFNLRYYHRLRLTKTYPIAVGMQGLETPAGLYDVQDKQVNPSWQVPNSSWAGSLAGQLIPPGPQDPLKARWMGINGGAGIHGIDPSEYGSIGTAGSHGCVRMTIPDVIDLYDRVKVGTPVYVV
ncbi:MAG TPA: L,D-transpeptidase family protein [Solirubrobacteraceae bacterium]|jgi:lipoprotein-anchoring transpeptidase ErfK/SrfK|nr:L,D-transpeptidase family protein [Solirubrobacteraceae bacterium]